MKKYLPEILMTFSLVVSFFASVCEKAPMPFHALYVVFAVVGTLVVCGMLIYAGVALLEKIDGVSYYFGVVFALTLFVLVMIGLNVMPDFIARS